MVEHDPVNHPSHYTSHPSGVECIEITRHMPFNPGNAMKYLWRAGQKENAPTKQDYEKAIWYIQDEIKRLFPEPKEKGMIEAPEDSYLNEYCPECSHRLGGLLYDYSGRTYHNYCIQAKAKREGIEL